MPKAESGAARRRGPAPGAARRPRRAPAAAALRRPAAARGAGARARHPSPTCCCSTSRCPISTPSCAQEVRVEIRELQRKLGLTTVMVTHDQEEALTMADRLVVMSEGAVRQVGTQQRSLRAPGRPLRRRLRRPHDLHRRRGRRPRALPHRRAASRSPARQRRHRAGRAGAAPGADLVAAAPRGRTGQRPSRRGGVRFLSRRVGRLHVRLSPQERVIVQIAEPTRAAARRRSGEQVACRLAGASRHRACGRREPDMQPAVARHRIATEDQHDEADKPTIIAPARPRRCRGLAAAVAPALPGRAGAQAKPARSCVGTWGGDYARLLTKNIEQPLLIKPKGWEVVQDQAGDPERRAKMLAERRLPRGTTDCRVSRAANMFQMHDAGVIEPIDYAKLKNATNLLPSMKYPYGVGHIYSGKVGVYNPKLIDRARELQGRVRSQARQQARHHRHPVSVRPWSAPRWPPAARSNDLEPGKKLLLECKKAGARIYPTNEAFAQGLKTEEFGIGVMWKARVVQWQNAGIQRADDRADRRRARLCLGLRHPEERAQQGRRLRLSGRHAGEERAGGLRRRHGLQPHRHQRRGRARPQQAHRLHARGGEARWSTSTTTTSPRTTSR